MTEEAVIEQVQIFIEAGKEYFKAYGECFITEDELKSVETIFNKFQEQQAELEKKDKMIDLIIKSWKQDDSRTVEEIKQYFEKQVEKE